MFNLTFYQWLVAALSAVMIGLSKTGLLGIGILAIPLMAWVLPARASTGVVLPMLIFADFFAVGYYRRFAVWSKLVRLLPCLLYTSPSPRDRTRSRMPSS